MFFVPQAKEQKMSANNKSTDVKFVFHGDLAVLFDQESMEKLEAQTAENSDDDEGFGFDGLVIFKAQYSWERKTLNQILRRHFQDTEAIEKYCPPEDSSTIEKLMAAAFRAGVEFARRRKP